MNITRKEREEMKALSKEVFGSTSRWKTILDKGLKELTTRTVVETVPGEDGVEDTTKESKQPILYGNNNVRQFHMRYFQDLDELKLFMLDIKTKRDAFYEQLRKMQEEEQAKKEKEELIQKVQEENAGSAL